MKLWYDLGMQRISGMYLSDGFFNISLIAFFVYFVGLLLLLYLAFRKPVQSVTVDNSSSSDVHQPT